MDTRTREPAGAVMPRLLAAAPALDRRLDLALSLEFAEHLAPAAEGFVALPHRDGAAGWV